MSYSAFAAAGRPRHIACLDLVEPLDRGVAGARTADESRRVNNCRRILNFGRTMGWPISHVLDHTVRRRRLRAIDGLEPLQIEPVHYRTGVSALSNRQFRESVEDQVKVELVILSLSLSRSCLATALAARDRGVAVALVEDVVCGSSDAAAGIDAIQTLSHSLAAPLVTILQTNDLVDVRRGLRVVS
jgi:nicotinamidase-related amidase